MGLDVFIKVQGAESDLVYLRNHLESHEMFCEFAEGLVYEGYDDLRIKENTLIGVFFRLGQEAQREGLLPLAIPHEIPEHFFHYGAAERLSRAELLGIYLRVVGDLLDEMNKHRFLVYAWSA